jgi:magnesium transporter
MIARYSYRGLTWVDLESPSREEVALLVEEFSLPATVGEELVTSTLRSKVDLYDDCMYLILHFPVAVTEKEKNSEQEVDFVIGKNFLITARYELIDPVQQFAKAFETSSFGTQENNMNRAGFVFMEMMKRFYQTSLHELEEFGREINDIEHRIFDNEEGAMVKQISRMSRKLLDFKQALRFHSDILHSYELSSARFFGDEYSYYASVITAEFNKVQSLLESQRDTILELQRTNDSLLSTRSNDIMKTFTILTFVMVPLTLITGIFGMNTNSDLVFIQNTKDFFFVIGAMVIVGIIMFLFFRFRKWL